MSLDEESLAWFLERTAVEKGVPAGRNSKQLLSPEEKGGLQPAQKPRATASHMTSGHLGLCISPIPTDPGLCAQPVAASRATAFPRPASSRPESLPCGQKPCWTLILRTMLGRHRASDGFCSPPPPLLSTELEARRILQPPTAGGDTS